MVVGEKYNSFLPLYDLSFECDFFCVVNILLLALKAPFYSNVSQYVLQPLADHDSNQVIAH